MMNKLEALFQQQGQISHAKANYRLDLQRENSVWFLQKGSMILFAVKKKKQQEGRRILLSTIEEGGLLFPLQGLTEGQFEVFAFSEQDITFIEISQETLDSSLNCPEMQQCFLPKLEHWVHQFSPLLTTEIEIKVDSWAQLGNPIQLQRGEVFSLRKSENPYEMQRVLWGDFEKEVLKLLGPYEIKIPEARRNFPIIPYQYFLALEEGEIGFKTTEQVINEKNWREGLQQFHIFLMRYLEKRQTKNTEEELQRFRKKEELQSETLHESLNQMAAILKEEIAEEQAHTSDPLFKACFIVGKSKGIELSLPERQLLKGNVKERLERIARHSNVRLRLANLTPKWWKKDAGNLIGFIGEDKHPVALLQNKWGFYEIHDPRSGTSTKLTEELARSLCHDVYSFYQLIPDDIHQGKKVLKLFTKRNWDSLATLGLYGLIATLLALVNPWAMAILFNDAIPNANMNLLYQLFAGLIVATVSSSLFLYFRSLILSRLTGIATAEIQSSLWDRLLKLPANFFRRFSAGDLLLRVWIMDQLTPVLGGNAPRTLLNSIFALFYLVMMSIYSMKLTLIAFFLIVSSLILTYCAARYNVKMQKKTLAIQGQINGALIQILSGISKLRVAGAENNAFAHWATQYAKSKHFEMKGQHAQSFIAATMTAFPLLSYLVIFAFVIKLEAAGKLSIGDFLAFNSAFLTFSVAFFDLNNTIMQVAHIFPSLNRSKVILKEDQEILQNKASPGKLTGDIRIDHVTFSYDSQSSPILKDVSIQVKPHEMIGIVGPSGSGKSTLIRMILGFETAQGGAIYYNGKDLSHLNINEVRKQMGVVLQGGGIVAGTLYQNVVAGGRYTQEEVDRAIRLSGFHRDLHYFPMGLHTVVPMNGETLSGGQKQRLLIARALLPRPKILLLDEATSALDNKSQSEISQNIDQLDITRIVIAHRLSTIRNANRIYVLEKGVITQSGTFDSLAHEKGLFADMLKRQKL